MIVRDMERRPFEQIRDEFFPNFSMIKLSRIDPQYFEKYYFKAELTEWSMYEKNPYCIITKIVGRVIDPVVIPTIYEIDQEDYPKEALEQAKQLTQQFEEKIK